MIAVAAYNTVSEAASALGSDAIYFGGGTLIMRSLNYGENSFSRIVRTTDPSLLQISGSSDRLIIGAGVTMRQLMTSDEARFLVTVAERIGGPAVRNMATVGGNLFAAHPYGDLATAFLALDAKVKTADGGEQGLETFLSNRSSFRGVVTSVSLARPQGSDFKFLKVSRTKPKGVSVMAIAAWLPGAGSSVQEPRIAFGAMAQTPKRATAAENALRGKLLDAQSVAAACAALAEDFQPPDDALASGWYRTQVAPVHLRRLLLGQGAQ